MGLFKSERVQTSQRRPVGQRASMADQQANELRYKAKSRLIGAVVLVILAIILVPLVMQDSPEELSVTEAPLVAPQGQTDVGAAGTLSVTTAPGVSASGTESTSQVVNPDGTVGTQAGTVEGSIAQGNIETTVPSTSVAASTATDPVAASRSTQSVAAATSNQNAVTAPASERKPSVADTKPAETKPVETKPAEPKPAEPKPVESKPAEPKVAAKPTPKPAEPKAAEPKAAEPKVAEKPAVVRTPSSRSTIKDQDRTDDGQAALALLEGRQTPRAAAAPAPKASAPAASGGSRFSVQLASHSTMDAARSHRERLSSSGVSNAYVQSATVNGRQTYRVRVGPFTSREAAQAAHTRLRGLGEGGFISAN